MMRRLNLPGGLEVFSLNPDETRFVHGEVFGARCYLRHGIELRDGDCVFDVGANIGMASVFFSKERRAVRIFAFEPSPAAFECLKANLELHRADAQTFECGLSREPGTAEFTFYPGNSVMSGFHADLEKDRAATKTFMVNSGFEPRHAELFLGSKFKRVTFPCRLRTLSDDHRRGTGGADRSIESGCREERERCSGGNPGGALGLIRQIVVEVHDEDGALDEVQDMLARHGFETTAEQDPQLKGTAIFSVFATHGTS